MPPYIDITGQRFGRLVAVEKSKKNGEYAVFQCDCGTVKEIKKSPVKNGKTQSCGCLWREVMTKSPDQAVLRFWKYVTKDQSTGCWNWHGCISREGYGRFSYTNNRSGYAHRFAYQIFREEIPRKMELDHLCRNRRCCNPDHLEIVTKRTNCLRGISPSALQAKQTHCKRNHLLSGDNVYLTKTGRRQCKECGRIRADFYYKSKANNRNLKYAR